MIDKLGLPFPLLADPDRSQAIEPYGLADPNDRRNIARPAVVIVSPDGDEAYRFVARDYADRPLEDLVVEELRKLGLPPTTQEPPELGPADPGPSAIRLDYLVPYYLGAKFAAKAMGERFPAAADEAAAYMAQLDRYVQAAKVAFKAKRQG